jgi:hypothetical protein
LRPFRASEGDVQAHPQGVDLRIEPVEIPRSWKTVPSMEFRNRCIQASDAVTFSMTWNDPPIVRVF